MAQPYKTYVLSTMYYAQRYNFSIPKHKMRQDWIDTYKPLLLGENYCFWYEYENVVDNVIGEYLYNAIDWENSFAVDNRGNKMELWPEEESI